MKVRSAGLRVGTPYFDTMRAKDRGGHDFFLCAGGREARLE